MSTRGYDPDADPGPLDRPDGTVYRSPRNGAVWVLSTGADHRRCLVGVYTPGGSCGVVMAESEAVLAVGRMDVVGSLPGTPAASSGGGLGHRPPRRPARVQDNGGSWRPTHAPDGATDRHSRAATEQAAARAAARNGVDDPDALRGALRTTPSGVGPEDADRFARLRENLADTAATDHGTAGLGPSVSGPYVGGQ